MKSKFPCAVPEIPVTDLIGAAAYYESCFDAAHLVRARRQTVRRAREVRRGRFA